MHLDIGTPNEKAMDADGKEVKVRDDLGLSTEPKRYAAPNCKDCYGRGSVIKVRQFTAKEAIEVAKDPEAGPMLQGGCIRIVDVCKCATKRYAKARAQVARAVRQDATPAPTVAAV